MKRLFRSHMLQLFKSRYRAAWMASVVAAALAILLTSTATYASTSKTPGLIGTAMTAGSASTPVTILSLTTSSAANRFHCPADNICVFNGPGYTGSVQFGSFPGVNTYIDLHILGGSNWRTLSYINNGDYRGWLNQSTTGNHGISSCMSPNSRNPNSTGPWDADRWLLLSTNPNPCS